MKRWFAGIVLLIMVCRVQAQLINWAWAKGAASPYNEVARDVAYDKNSKCAYIGGWTEGGLQNVYGPLFTNVLGSKDGFVAKYNDAGNVLWAFQIGGTGIDEIKSIAVAPSGEIYVLGNFQATVDFDPGIGVQALISNALSQDGFLAKYSSSGNFLWAVKFGGISTEETYKVYTDANGVYICGSYIGSASFTSTNSITKSTAAVQGQANFFGAKYNHDGIVQWVVSGGSTKNDLALDVVADNTRVYFTGSYERTCTLYNASGVASSTVQSISPDKFDVFVAAYNQNGSFAWSTNASSLDVDEGHAITQDANNIYISGCFKNNTLNFRYPNPQYTLQNEGNYDIFVACISKASGSYQWVSNQTGSGNGTEEPYEMDVDPSGNIVIAGYFLSELNYSPFGDNDLENSGASDIFLLGLSSSGNYLWSKKAGDDKTDTPHGITITPEGEIYLAGVYRGTSSFGGIELAEDEQDNAFLAKTGCNLMSNNVIPISQTVCVSAPPQIIGSSPQGDPGSNYTFLWQESEDNLNWISAAGTNSLQNYTPPVLYGNTYFRRIACSDNVCNDSLASNSMFLKTNPVTPAAIAGNDQSVCTPSAVVSGNMPATVSGTWSVVQGTAFIQSPNSFSTSVILSSNSVTLRWSIKSGYCNVKQDDMKITKISFPNAYAGLDTLIDSSWVQLSANMSPGLSGAWSVIAGNAQIDSINQPVTKARNLSVGENIFRWKLNNSVCESSDDVLVRYRGEYSPPEVFEIPNGFTPNNDGKNDFFVIKGLEKYSAARLRIFNRWGSRIFEDNNYRNNWNGTNMSEEKLVDDTYFYTLEVPQKGSFSGFVILKKH